MQNLYWKDILDKCEDVTGNVIGIMCKTDQALIRRELREYNRRGAEVTNTIRKIMKMQQRKKIRKHRLNHMHFVQLGIKF